MEATIRKFEEPELQQLFEKLGSDDGLQRKKARGILVTKGKESIGFLSKIITHPEHVYRWEAAKALDELKNTEAIPYLVQLLDDDKSDIRWIAAEGLINLGKQSVIPLLKTLIEKSESVFILEGAHHIIYDLNEQENLPEEFPADKLLSLLKYPEREEGVKMLAYEILNKLKK